MRPATMYTLDIKALKYPKDAKRIGGLSIEAFQAWYLAQDARDMIYLGQFKEFQRFVFWNYTIKVKSLRFWLKVKRWIIHG